MLDMGAMMDLPEAVWLPSATAELSSHVDSFTTSLSGDSCSPSWSDRELIETGISRQCLGRLHLATPEAVLVSEIVCVPQEGFRERTGPCRCRGGNADQLCLFVI